MNRNQQFLDDVKSLESYVLSELNIKKLTTSKDGIRYGVQLRANPNQKLLGIRLKNQARAVMNYFNVCLICLY